MSARSRKKQYSSSSRLLILLLLLSLSVMLYQDGYDFRSSLLRASQAFAPLRFTQTRLLSFPAFSAWQISLPDETRIVLSAQEARSLSQRLGAGEPVALQSPDIPLKVTADARQLSCLSQAVSAVFSSLSLLSELSALPDDAARARASVFCSLLEAFIKESEPLFSDPLPPEAAGLFSLLSSACRGLQETSEGGACCARSAFSSLALEFFAYSDYLSG